MLQKLSYYDFLINFSSKLVFSRNREVLCRGAETQTGPDDNEDKVGTNDCFLPFFYVCFVFIVFLSVLVLTCLGKGRT